MSVSSSASTRPPVGLLWWAAGAAVVTASCIAWLDAPTARWLAQWEPSPLWPTLLWVLELLGGLTLSRWTVATALVAVCAVVTMTPRWRASAPTWWFVTLVQVLSKLLTAELKDATGRLRPQEWLAHGGGAEFFAGGVSFPSGHVAYFLSLTLPLVVARPRWGKPLLLVPALAALCRVAVNAHFLSDVSGAVVWVCLLTVAIAAALRPLERRWRASAM
jgi:membrane-associated phospholipid phosphatase